MKSLFVTLLLVFQSPPTGSLPPEVDEALFREGLRSRGLTTWLEQYGHDTPPVDQADRLLREREALLVQAADEPDAARRSGLIAEAADLLERVITAFPHDPRCLRWRLERGRDLIERIEPQVFDALLLYELPGRQRDRARRLAARAQAELILLEEGVSSAWQSLETLDEAALAALRGSAGVRQLEVIDGHARMLGAWVRLYLVLTEDDPEQRVAQAEQLLDDILMAGWTQLPAGQEVRRCTALVLATMSARVAGHFEEAERFAREIVGLLKTVTSPEPALRQASLIAVLEQVRILRDAGRLEKARAAARQAVEWIEQTRATQVPALLAGALLESSVLAREKALATAPAGKANAAVAAIAVPLTPGSLAPLTALAGKSAEIRDGLYRAMEGLPAGPDQLADAVFLQFWAGAAIDSAWRKGTESSAETDLQQAAQLLKEATAGDVVTEAHTQAELLYLLGRAEHLLSDHGAAAAAMTELSTKWPVHDRAEVAAQAAVVISRDWLASCSDAERAAAREAFVHSVRVWRSRSPDAPAVRQLQFFLAAELERAGQLAQAAEEYGRVDSTDAYHVHAAVGRARCLTALVPRVATQPAASEPESGELALHAALEASRTALAAALAASPTDGCLAAEAAVLLARLANDRRTQRPDEAVEALDQATAHLRMCSAWSLPGMRERLEGLRQLRRWDELVQTYAVYVESDVNRAAAAGAVLLAAIRQDVEAQLAAGNEQAVRAAAEQGTRLAAILHAHRSDPSPADEPGEAITLDLTRAWLLVHAGRQDQALPLYDRCREILAERKVDGALALRCELGRAECLLALNRVGTAAPLYGGLLGRLPEHSDAWWEAYVGTLRCQEQLKADRQELLRSIQQQRRIAPDLGGPRWRRELERLESRLTAG